MKIQLKERRIAVLKDLKVGETFKIPENDLVFMKIDTEGLTVFVTNVSKTIEEERRELIIPESKVAVLCLVTGRTQFLGEAEKVQIVELESREVIEEKISE